jgi:SAM-dependent methyltransferase
MPRVDTEHSYRYSLQQFGHTAEGVQWHFARSQLARFEVLRRFLPEDLSTLTLADAGCGLGDLYLFLATRGERPGRYLGLDVLAPMVEAVRSEPAPEARYCLWMSCTMLCPQPTTTSAVVP